MKKTLALAGLFVGLLSPTFGQFTGSESFSGALGANWQSPPTYNNNGTGFASKSLSSASGQLQWVATTNSGGTANGGDARLQWIGNYGSYDSDWSASLSVYNNWDRSVTGSQVDIGLMLWNNTDPSDYVRLVLKQTGPALNVVHSGLHNNGGPQTAESGQNNPINTANTSIGNTGTLGISYSSSNKVMTTYYDFGSGWTLLGSYGISGSGGGTKANANWATSGASAFAIGIIADVFTNSNAIVLGSSPIVVYADDFALSATPITAVPESSTYAMLAGIASLGFAFWRRRRAAP